MQNKHLQGEKKFKSTLGRKKQVKPPKSKTPKSPITVFPDSCYIFLLFLWQSIQDANKQKGWKVRGFLSTSAYVRPVLFRLRLSKGKPITEANNQFWIMGQRSGQSWNAWTELKTRQKMMANWSRRKQWKKQAKTFQYRDICMLRWTYSFKSCSELHLTRQ